MRGPRAARLVPGPRLTGLGVGLFAVAAMLVSAGLSWLLFDGSLLLYGLLFLPVSALTALWVRPADLVTPPIAVPPAFALGLLPLAEGEGFAAHAMGLLTSLALHAGWLYGGTLIAGAIAAVRKLRELREAKARREARGPAVRRPARAQRADGARTPRSAAARPAPGRSRD